MDPSAELLNTVHEIRDLLLLLAEPAIAQRDQKHRAELRRLAGSSARKAKAAYLMDGTRTQAAIQKKAGIDKGQLSTFVKQLNAGGLLAGEAKQPKLCISIPTNFFEAGSHNE